MEGILTIGCELKKKKIIHKNLKLNSFVFNPSDLSVKICELNDSLYDLSLITGNEN